MNSFLTLTLSGSLALTSSNLTPKLNNDFLKNALKWAQIGTSSNSTIFSHQQMKLIMSLPAGLLMQWISAVLDGHSLCGNI